MSMKGPDNEQQIVTTEVSVAPINPPKKQTATVTSKQAAADFTKSRKLPDFLSKNRTEMQAHREKLQENDSASEMKIDKQTLAEYPLKLQRAPAPEEFEENEKEFNEVAKGLFEEFDKLSIVDPFAPTEPQKPVVEKTETASNGYLSGLWATKSPAELEYDSKMKIYTEQKKKFDSSKLAYDKHHLEMEKLKSALDSVQRNFEKLATFEPSLPAKTIQADLGLSAFKDAQKGVVSQFLADKHGKNNFNRTIKEERERAIEAQKQSLLARAVNARNATPENVVEEEMKQARERRNALTMK